jgi:hypothetical protein
MDSTTPVPECETWEETCRVACIQGMMVPFFHTNMQSKRGITAAQKCGDESNGFASRNSPGRKIIKRVAPFLSTPTLRICLSFPVVVIGKREDLDRRNPLCSEIPNDASENSIMFMTCSFYAPRKA